MKNKRNNNLCLPAGGYQDSLNLLLARVLIDCFKKGNYSKVKLYKHLRSTCDMGNL